MTETEKLIEVSAWELPSESPPHPHVADSSPLYGGAEQVVGAEPSPTTLVVYADDGKASLNEAGFKRMVVMFVLQVRYACW